MIVSVVMLCALTATPEYDTPTKLADLDDERVRECSGIAIGRANPGVIWVHNDSGDGPHLYATNAEGKALGRVTLDGVKARDWEDMCSFTMDGAHYLLIGDVGDNRRKRESVVLYLVREPTLTLEVGDESDNENDHTIEVEGVIRVRFEGGPHNCESVAFDVGTRTIMLVSKHDVKLGVQAKVFALPLPQPLPDDPSAEDDEGSDDKPTVHEAKRIASVPAMMTMALDISPDGRRAALLTTTRVMLFDRDDDHDDVESWARAFNAKPARIGKPTKLPQAEALCYDADGESLLITSEGKPCPLWRVPAKR